MKTRLITKAASLLIVVTLTLPFLACPGDSWLHLSGSVFEWTDAPEGATGYITFVKPKEMQLQPLTGVVVEVTKKPSFSERLFRIKPRVLESDTTGTIGMFALDPAVASTNMAYVIVAHKDGYDSVSNEYSKQTWVSSFVIILVKSKSK